MKLFLVYGITKDLETYILQTQSTLHPLKVTGFDFQFSGTLSAKHFITELQTVLVNFGASSLLSDKKWVQFQDAVTRQIKYSNFFKKPSLQDTALVGELIQPSAIFSKLKIQKQRCTTNWLYIGKLPAATFIMM